MLEFHGPPQDRAGAQGAHSRAAWRARRGNQRRSLTTTTGAYSGRPYDADTVPRRSRGEVPGSEVATLVQGRFKRDGSASAEPEPHGGTGPKAVGSSPQHAQNQGPASSGNAGGATTGGPAAPAPAAPKGPTGPGPRIALRNWRISTRLVSLLALPVVAATSLGALRINQSMDDIQQLDNMKLLTDMTKQATELAAALQEDRRGAPPGPRRRHGHLTPPRVSPCVGRCRGLPSGGRGPPRRPRAGRGLLLVLGRPEALVLPEVRGLEGLRGRGRDHCGGTAGLPFQGREKRRRVDEGSAFRHRPRPGPGVP